MVSDISLKDIDTSYWLTKDQAWVTERQANWLELEQVIANSLFKPKKALSIIKQYYLKGKMPNWEKLKEWENSIRHLDLFCFIWLHPSWDEAILTPLRDAYMASDLIIEGDINEGIGSFLSNGTTRACTINNVDPIPRFIDTEYHNELLFEILMGDLNNTTYEIQGYTLGDPVVMFGLPKRVYELPKANLDRTLGMGEWLCLDALFPYNKDMLFQYDQPLEWWYQGSKIEEDYFEKSKNRGSRKYVEKALYRFHNFNTQKEGDTCRTRFVHKIRKILDEREFISEFKQMWEDAKAGKIEVKDPWKR